MSWDIHSPINVRQARTAAQGPATFLGDRTTTISTGGYPQHWVYIKNIGAAAIDAGDVAIRDIDDADAEDHFGGLIAPINVVQPRFLVLGVPAVTIPVDGFGWVQTYGPAQVRFGATDVAAESPFTTGDDTAGQCVHYATPIDVSATVNQSTVNAALRNLAGTIGYTTTAVTADDALANVFLLISQAS